MSTKSYTQTRGLQMTRKQQASGVPERVDSIMLRVSVALWLVAVLTYLLLMTLTLSRM
jgi:hypothetical protein